MIRLACLDMAGTTVRDGGLVEAAFSEAMSVIGLSEGELPGALQHVHQTMGLPKEVVFLELLGDEARARAAVEAFDVAILRAIVEGRAEPIEGAEDAIRVMRESGVAVCLTTGFTAEVQAAIVEVLGWGDLVDLTLCPGPGVRGRPYPDLVLAAVLRLEIDDVRDVAVAGDTANDLLAGSRAGAGVLAGVLTGAHGRDELEAAPHTHILDSIRALPATLR